MSKALVLLAASVAIACDGNIAGSPFDVTQDTGGAEHQGDSDPADDQSATSDGDSTETDQDGDGSPPSDTNDEPSPLTPYTSLTGWTLEFIGGDVTKAYPNLEYQQRLAVRGGAYPYTFKLLQAPSGMQIHTRRGQLKWTPTQADTTTTVSIQVTDSAGATLNHSFTLEVTTAGFYFVDAEHGSDSASGSSAAPFKTLKGIQSLNLDSGAILYVKAGTYAVDGLSMNKLPFTLMAYPGQSPVLDCAQQSGCVGISPNDGHPMLIQGFEVINSTFKAFWLDGQTSNITWRNNNFHDLVVISDGMYENPSFIFTQDGAWNDSSRDVSKLISGVNYGYKHLIMQDNQFYNIDNHGAIHASSTVWYDVSFSLFEDNIVHDIDAGECFHDKDDGWFNTARNNVCYNLSGYGYALNSQYSQGEIEINHNLFVGNVNDYSFLNVGSQPGYIKNIYVHHNTVVDGQVTFGDPIGDSRSQKYVFEHNLFFNDSLTLPFYSANGSYDFASGKDPEQIYISALLTDKKGSYDGNLYWGTSSSQRIISWSWDQYGRDMTEWKSYDFDSSSLFFVDPMLSTDGAYTQSLSSSYFGSYGRDFDAGSWE